MVGIVANSGRIPDGKEKNVRAYLSHHLVVYCGRSEVHVVMVQHQAHYITAEKVHLDVSMVTFESGNCNSR